MGSDVRRGRNEVHMEFSFHIRDICSIYLHSFGQLLQEEKRTEHGTKGPGNPGALVRSFEFLRFQYCQMGNHIRIYRLKR